MSPDKRQKPRRKYVAVIASLILIGALGAGWIKWSTRIRERLVAWIAIGENPKSPNEKGSKPEGDHSGHDHAHGDEGASNSLEVTESALKNIGFEPVTIALSDFDKTLQLPATVVERPGRSQVQIPAPLSGVVTKIFAIEGESIEANAPIFELRLTHEELVTAQKEFLQSAENLDVINREIKRLEAISEGVLAGKRIIEQQYEKQKVEAALRAQREALVLHGISEEQIEKILSTRKLLKQLTVYAPSHPQSEKDFTEKHRYSIQSLPVKLGEQVESGEAMAVLSDHCMLYLEGRAFEGDVSVLRESLEKSWKLTARPLDGSKGLIRDLEILYLADHIDPETRAFRFYAELPNSIALSRSGGNDKEFLYWKYRPGQKMEISIPVQRWEARIVVPAEAVVEEGAEKFVFIQNGNKFERRPIHVEYRDPSSVVIENDGSIFEGDVIAAKGAYQIQLALKNKSGGGVDPHAGHNH